MEIYTLDTLLRREYIVDKFESLIWTERYLGYGDFQIDIVSTLRSRTLLKPDTYLAMSDSNYVMRIESLEDDVDETGRKILTVKGRSLEAILIDRVAKESLLDLTTAPKWTITNTPGAIARKIFHDICVTGILDVGDIIPFIFEGTFMPADTLVEPVDPITVELEPMAVYDALTQILNVWTMGFRILRQRTSDLSKLWFDVYIGSDRTSTQAVRPAVVFTPELDNLQNTKELTTIDNARNVAYVFSPAGFQMVYAQGVDPTVDGFERRVLAVNASDITSDNPDVPTALIQRGNEELAKARILQAFDGEISQRSGYQYGRDYNLGDIVEIRNDNGVTNNMRVTEQIFVSDREGERTYPTLTLNTFINTGSWLSWMSGKTWADLDTDPTTWSEQP